MGSHHREAITEAIAVLVDESLKGERTAEGRVQEVHTAGPRGQETVLSADGPRSGSGQAHRLGRGVSGREDTVSIPQQNQRRKGLDT